MSATVAAALKKIAVAILTDKKLRKTFLGIVLGVIIIIVMPFAAIIALFNGDINIDTDRLQTLVVQKMSAEEQARLQRTETLIYEIDRKMEESGYDTRQILAARVLVTLVLQKHIEDEDFAGRLIRCFDHEQTDNRFIEKINDEFDTDIDAGEFTRMIESVHNKPVP